MMVNWVPLALGADFRGHRGCEWDRRTSLFFRLGLNDWPMSLPWCRSGRYLLPALITISAPLSGPVSAAVIVRAHDSKKTKEWQPARSWRSSSSTNCRVACCAAGTRGSVSQSEQPERLLRIHPVLCRTQTWSLKCREFWNNYTMTSCCADAEASFKTCFFPCVGPR